MLQTMIYDFLGTPPPGSEWLQYQYAGITYLIFLVFFLVFITSVIILTLSIMKR